MGLDLLALGLTCAAALLWEFGEMFGDVFFGTSTQTTAAMTLRDLFLAFAGASCFLLAHAWWRRKPRS